VAAGQLRRSDTERRPEQQRTILLFSIPVLPLLSPGGFFACKKTTVLCSHHQGFAMGASRLFLIISRSLSLFLCIASGVVTNAYRSDVVTHVKSCASSGLCGSMLLTITFAWYKVKLVSCCTLHINCIIVACCVIHKKEEHYCGIRETTTPGKLLASNSFFFFLLEKKSQSKNTHSRLQQTSKRLFLAT
jgi:hypothetical protein